MFRFYIKLTHKKCYWLIFFVRCSSCFGIFNLNQTIICKTVKTPVFCHTFYYSMYLKLNLVYSLTGLLVFLVHFWPPLEEIRFLDCLKFKFWVDEIYNKYKTSTLLETLCIMIVSVSVYRQCTYVIVKLQT